MADVIYLSYWHDAVRGLIPEAANVKVMLTTSAYTANELTHMTRSQVTNEVAAGNGYTAGGLAATYTIARDDANRRINITLAGAEWTTAASQTLTARNAVYYVATGNAATDRLIACNDFGSDQIASNGGKLTVAASTLRLVNPV